MATQKEINIERLNQAKAAGGVIPAANVVQPITPVTDNGTVGGAITTEAITSTPYTIPAPVNNTTARDRFTASATPVEIPQENKTDTRNDVLSSIQNIVQEQGTQASFEEQAQIDNQLEQKRQTLNSLNAQALKVKNSYDRRIKELEKNQQGQFGGANQADIAKLRQEANEELANIAVQQAVAQGDVNTALTIIKDKVDAKFEPLKNQLETYKLQFSLLQNDMTESEKLEAQRIINKEQKAIDQQYDLEKKKLDVVTEAAKAGLTGEALLRVSNAETIEEAQIELANEIRGASGGNYYNSSQKSAISRINENVSKNATYSKTSSMRNFGDNVVASLSLGNGVADIAAINQFQKVIDEGAVTRDQDVKLIQGAQSLSNQLKTQIKKLEKGDQLSPEQRTQMRTLVESLYEAQVNALLKDPYIQAKINEARINGIDADDTILGEISGFVRSSQTTSSGVTSSGVGYKVE